MNSKERWLLRWMARGCACKEDMMANILVTYFSASGVTARTAKEVAGILNADLYEIAPRHKYTSADLDWMNKRSRSTVEMQDPDARPELLHEVPDLTGYDTILVGFPVWWYTAPRIINTFLESADYSGKRIYAFATSGGSGVDKCVKDLQRTYPALDIRAGRLWNGKVQAADAEALMGQ